MLQFDGDEWVAKGLKACDPIRLPACLNLESTKKSTSIKSCQTVIQCLNRKKKI